MAIRLPSILSGRQIFHRVVKESTSAPGDVPKGYSAIYVGARQKKRFVVPISYLNEPSFQILLNKAKEKFGFDHPMGGLTIPCSKESFIGLTASLNRL